MASWTVELIFEKLYTYTHIHTQLYTHTHIHTIVHTHTPTHAIVYTHTPTHAIVPEEAMPHVWRNHSRFSSLPNLLLNLVTQFTATGSHSIYY